MPRIIRYHSHSVFHSRRSLRRNRDPGGAIFFFYLPDDPYTTNSATKLVAPFLTHFRL